MYLKDYYGILEVEPSATLSEIKKAYRKLALQFHPDRNNNDPWAAARFSEIKEAYEVLTNPSKKEYYLQQRWYNQSMGKKRSTDVITPVTVLKQVLDLEKYVSTLDLFRMDKQGLQQFMLDILSDSTIDQLKKFDEPDITRETVTLMLKAMQPLPKDSQSPVLKQLRKLSGPDKTAREILDDFSARTERKYRKEKYSLIVIIAVTVILCLLIWLAGR